MFVVVQDSVQDSNPVISRDRKNKIFLIKKPLGNLIFIDGRILEDADTCLDSIFVSVNTLIPIFRRIRMSINHLVVGSIRYPYFKSIFRKYRRSPRCSSLFRPTFQKRSLSIRIFSEYSARSKTG